MAVEDIIFGKNRHMFGGIEPSNMLVFEAVEPVVQSGVVKINVQIPDDTVIDSQVLCTVAGAVIVRRFDRYPEDEFDGDVVATITDKNQIMVQDFPMNDGETYKTCFYTAFPYSNQGVYNRSISNRFVINIPKDLALLDVKFKYDEETDTSKVRIYGTFEDEGDSGTVAGVMIRKSTTYYPTTETDGEFVADVKYDVNELNFIFDDTNVTTGIMYYYVAFPYNSDGVYAHDTNNKISCNVRSSTWIYGYDLDTNDSNPETRVTYPGGLDNTFYTPVSHTGTNDGTTDTYVFSYGNWEDAEFMPKPCMLKTDGVVGEYLDPNDYGKTINGEPSNVANIDYDGNAMMEWGKIFTKRWEDENGVYHFRCSNQKIDDDYDCWCNYDKNGNQIDNFYTAIYLSSGTRDGNGYFTDKLRSISDTTIVTGTTAVKSEYGISSRNGSGWCCELLCDRLLIQDLLVLIGKSTNTQTVFGGQTGVTSTVTGLLNTSGLFGEYGSSVKVFGMEVWWGEVLRYIHGWQVDPRSSDSVYMVRLKPPYRLYKSSTDNGRISGYLTEVSGVVVKESTAGKSAYIKKMKTMPYGRIPYHAFDANDVIDGGSASTYECDMLYTSTGNGYGSPHAYCGNNTYDNTVNELKTGAFFALLTLGPDRAGSFTCVALSYKADSTTH